MSKVITKNEEETFRLGKKMGRQCLGGEIFALYGNLGAGKTKFLQGLADGLGIKDKVNSPTFNILKIYNSSGKAKIFCHVDAYRLNSGQDLVSLGIEEFFSSPKTVTAIEWSEKVKDIIPVRAKNIYLKVVSENEREIQLN